jgi:hypothetical protein
MAPKYSSVTPKKVEESCINPKKVRKPNGPGGLVRGMTEHKLFSEVPWNVFFKGNLALPQFK